MNLLWRKKSLLRKNNYKIRKYITIYRKYLRRSLRINIVDFLFNLHEIWFDFRVDYRWREVSYIDVTREIIIKTPTTSSRITLFICISLWGYTIRSLINTLRIKLTLKMIKIKQNYISFSY